MKRKQRTPITAATERLNDAYFKGLHFDLMVQGNNVEKYKRIVSNLNDKIYSLQFNLRPIENEIVILDLACGFGHPILPMKNMLDSVNVKMKYIGLDIDHSNVGLVNQLYAEFSEMVECYTVDCSDLAAVKKIMGDRQADILILRHPVLHWAMCGRSLFEMISDDVAAIRDFERMLYQVIPAVLKEGGIFLGSGYNEEEYKTLKKHLENIVGLGKIKTNPAATRHGPIDLGSASLESDSHINFVPNFSVSNANKLQKTWNNLRKDQIIPRIFTGAVVTGVSTLLANGIFRNQYENSESATCATVTTLAVVGAKSLKSFMPSQKINQRVLRALCLILLGYLFMNATTPGVDPCFIFLGLGLMVNPVVGVLAAGFFMAMNKDSHYLNNVAAPLNHHLQNILNP